VHYRNNQARPPARLCDSSGELLSVTGGIRGFSGASGFIAETPFGTNATGCPNFRAKFRLRSGARRD